MLAYRKDLMDAGYSRSSIALKLSVLRRLYEAIRRRGLRQDNPAAGIKAPRDRTSRNERVKYLPLDGLKRLLVTPKGDSPRATRGRAMLVLMAVPGLRSAEVADLRLEDVDLSTAAQNSLSTSSAALARAATSPPTAAMPWMAVLAWSR